MAVFPAGESISISEVIEAKNYFCNYISNIFNVKNIKKFNCFDYLQIKND